MFRNNLVRKSIMSTLRKQLEMAAALVLSVAAAAVIGGGTLIMCI
jgi:hypothetical protein